MMAALVALHLLSWQARADAARDTTEAQAAAMIEARGGKLTRDESSPGKPIVKVDLAGTSVSDADLIHLRSLAHLSELNLANTRVREGLVYLKKLPELKVIDLSGTAVGDWELEYLEYVSSLRTVNLKGTKITRTGLVSLCKAVPRARIIR
jgi:uncharacterized protein YjbI with pentapeptide repeats